MSKILVDTIDTRSGTTTLTLGSTNAGTIALGSGDVQSNFLYPAFEAHSASNQTISNNTYTKVTLGTEIFDSDGKFASDKFTPTIAGKYFVYGSVRLQVDASQMNFGQCSIYKNGSLYAERIIDFRNNNGTQMNVDIATTIDMDSDDYVELYAKILYGGGSEIFITTDNKGSHFGAYRLIGV